MKDHEELVSRVRVPSNIALIKYWGKRDNDLILPLNDSISLSIDDIYADTTLTAFTADSITDSVTINGEVVDLNTSKRFSRVFNEIRSILAKSSRKRKSDQSPVENLIYSFKIDSTTNFPVAAGLASSAAGFAAIAYAAGTVFNFDESTITRIARLGSGSACRSVLEGLVQWQAGVKKCGSDSIAKTLFEATHWPDLRAVIIVFDDNKKETGSTIGMQRSVETSELLKHRVEVVVPQRVEEIIKAFEEKSFYRLAEIIMKESNQFHAVCMDTYPPNLYLRESSFKLISLIHKFNADATRAAYTFDAGPNACIFLEEQNVKSLLDLLTVNFPSDGQFPIRKTIVSSVGGGPAVLK